MKNYTLNVIILLASAIVLSTTSCKTVTEEKITPNIEVKEKSALQKLYESSANGKATIFVGDTTIPYKELRLHEAPSNVNIENLKNAKGELRIIAVGGGMCSGARNFGLYRNAQLTAFPNLIARQIKIEFKQPLFGEKEFNGYGYKAFSRTTNGVPKYNVVKNDIALLKSSPIIELNPYQGEIDNWAIPFTALYGLRFNRELAQYNSLDNAYKTRILLNTKSKQGENNIEYNILNQRFDFFIMESGLDSYIISFLANGLATVGSTNGNLSEPPYIKIMEYARKIGAKGAIANIPDITDFPFVNFVLPKDIRKVNQSEIYVKSNSYSSSKQIETVADGCIFVPNALADSLMNLKIPVSEKRGLSPSKPLDREDVYMLDRLKITLASLSENNQTNIPYWAKANNYPIVDLYTLFKNVAKGTISEDGTRVNKANFFSSDGIFPSAFGQAIIANEYIKTINSYYKTNIPLIKTAYYLDK